MKTFKYTIIVITLIIWLLGCAPNDINQLSESPKLDAARDIVEAVNAKESKQYVRDLHEDVIVTMYDGEIRLRGKQAIQANRENHFQIFPNARNELVHAMIISQLNCFYPHLANERKSLTT